MFSAIIVANGNSNRFGSQNKLLHEIDNDILICKTLKQFLIDDFKEIIVVCPKEIEDIVLQNLNARKILFCRGGKTREESVLKGLNLVKHDYVLIHDGARPYVNQTLIKQIISELQKYDVVIPILPITSALKRIGNKKIYTLDRNDFVISQTPQGFKKTLLAEAFELVFDKIDLAYDDAQIVEMSNIEHNLKLIDGDVRNIKITYLEDILK